jgi:hypothetical protein
MPQSQYKQRTGKQKADNKETFEENGYLKLDD